MRTGGLVQYKDVILPVYENPIVEIIWSCDHLISTMGFPILVRWHFYIESGPWRTCVLSASLWEGNTNGHILKLSFQLSLCYYSQTLFLDLFERSMNNGSRLRKMLIFSLCFANVSCPWMQLWWACMTHCCTHFTNDFSITIQIRWKFHLALIQLLMTISQQNLAHATTAQLSCHVPNIVAITLLVFGWEQNEISITFELWWKNC